MRSGVAYGPDDPVLARKGCFGVFGKRKEWDSPIYAGDRLELCSPLLIDPKTVRRERPPDHSAIRDAMKDVAGKRRRFGYWRIGVMLERQVPCGSLRIAARIDSREVRRDSGGPGKFRGGLGSTMHFENITEGRWNMERPRRQHCLPWGLGGGQPGEAGTKLLKTPKDTTFTDVDLSRHLVPEKSEVLIHAGSGGGWGDPLARDAALVAADVQPVGG